jgi:hypothetical protein
MRSEVTSRSNWANDSRTKMRSCRVASFCSAAMLLRPPHQSLPHPHLLPGQQSEPSDRDADPSRPVGGFVGDLVSGFFDQKEIGQIVDGCTVVRGCRFPISLQECDRLNVTGSFDAQQRQNARTKPGQPNLHQRQSPPSGNAIFQGRDKDPETTPAIQWAGCRDKMRARIATSSGLFALKLGKSVDCSIRKEGTPGRCPRVRCSNAVRTVSGVDSSARRALC